MLGHLRVGLGTISPLPDEHLLCEFRFDGSPAAALESGIVSLSLPTLANPGSECWYTRQAVRSVMHNDSLARITDEWAFIALPQHNVVDASLAQLSHELILQLHATSTDLGFAYVQRLWVVIPNIHTGSGDAERYKQFCLGRHEAYVELGLFPEDFPAATVIGSAEEALQIYALVGTQASQPMENPRQVSAYHYPREYGPRSPSFSRARITTDLSMISGTAAVRGADSQHPDCLQAQWQDIGLNLDALAHAAKAPSDWRKRLQYGRIYLRDPNHLTQLQNLIRTDLPEAAHWPVLQADICRPELMCEIEAAYA